MKRDDLLRTVLEVPVVIPERFHEAQAWLGPSARSLEYVAAAAVSKYIREAIQTYNDRPKEVVK